MPVVLLASAVTRCQIDSLRKLRTGSSLARGHGMAGICRVDVEQSGEPVLESGIHDQGPQSEPRLASEPQKRKEARLSRQTRRHFSCACKVMQVVGFVSKASASMPSSMMRVPAWPAFRYWACTRVLNASKGSSRSGHCLAMALSNSGDFSGSTSVLFNANVLCIRRIARFGAIGTSSYRRKGG